MEASGSGRFMEVLDESRGMDGSVTAPQSSLRIALHPGCHVIRPSQVLKVGLALFAKGA